MRAPLLAVVVAAAASAAGASPAATIAGAPTRFDDVRYDMGDERTIVVDGWPIRVIEAGPPAQQAPTIALLHCFGLSMKVWHDVVPVLVHAGYHVVAWDAPGHGKSGRGVYPVHLEDSARLGWHVLDALGVQRASLVGNSMGGGVALSMALREPARASHLVLVDSVGLDLRAWFSVPWRTLDASHARGAPDWAWGLVYDLAVEKRDGALSQQIRAELLSTRHDEAMGARATDAFYTVVVDILGTDHTADLVHVHTPTLVITGAHDRLVNPEHAKRLTDGIRGATLVTYDDLGHLPEIEDGPRVARDVLAFVAAHTGSTTTPGAAQ